VNVKLELYWPVASIIGGLLLIAALGPYFPSYDSLAMAAVDSALLLVPLALGLGGDRRASISLAAYAVAWASLALAGLASPIAIVPASAVVLVSASRLSFRVGAAINRILNAFISLPPGRCASQRSMFKEAYACNGLFAAALCSLGAAALRSSLPLATAGAALAFVSLYLAAFRDDLTRSFDLELPFLMILSSFYSSAGHRGMEASLESITDASAKVFRALGRTRLAFLHEKLFSSSAPGQALKRFAVRQEDTSLKQIVDGYRTVAATGGDVYAYLVEQTDRSLSKLEETRLERVRTTRGLAEVLLLTLSLAPSIAMTISIIGYNGSYTLLLLSGALPVASLLALAIVDLYLPPVKDQVEVTWGLPLGLAAAASVLVVTLGLSSLPVSVTAASVALLLPLSVEYLFGASAARRDERESLKMVTSIVEALQVGKSVHEALRQMSLEGLPPSFSKIVNDFNTQISLGVPPQEAGAMITSKSWVTKATFVVIGHAMVLGGGLEIVERFRSFLSRYVDSWDAVRREALWTVALSASLPFVTLGGVSVITSLEGSFAGTAALPGLSMTLRALPLQTVLLAFVEVSALAAVVSCKLSGLTIKATPAALATMAATLASLIMFGLA